MGGCKCRRLCCENVSGTTVCKRLAVNYQLDDCGSDDRTDGKIEMPRVKKGKICDKLDKLMIPRRGLYPG